MSIPESVYGEMLLYPFWPRGNPGWQVLYSHFIEENVEDIREKVIHPASQTFF